MLCWIKGLPNKKICMLVTDWKLWADRELFVKFYLTGKTRKLCIMLHVTRKIKLDTIRKTTHTSKNQHLKPGAFKGQHSSYHERKISLWIYRGSFTTLKKHCWSKTTLKHFAGVKQYYKIVTEPGKYCGKTSAKEENLNFY